MDDDSVLKAVRGHVEEERVEVQKLETFCRGEGTAPEAIAPLCEPLSESIRESMATSALAILKPQTEPRQTPGAKAKAVSNAKLKWKGKAWAYYAAGSVAIAAAVLFHVSFRSSTEVFPAYSVEVKTDRTIRGTESPQPLDDAIEIPQKGPVIVLVRPETNIKRQVAGFAFLERNGELGELRFANSIVDVADGGSVRFTLAAEQLENASRLVLVIADANTIHGADDARARAKGNDAQVVVIRRRVVTKASSQDR